MEFYRIEKVDNKVFVRCLTYNERSWGGYQWNYMYIRLNTYPTNESRYATDFESVEKAQDWIKQHQPV